jgi:NACHT domain- and WD repeat-containing protein
MAQASRTFRVFVSSTFNDLKAERNALQERVYPRLKALCAQYSTRFQAIDLRWGVSEEAGLDQQTMNICLGEIARCQKTSPRPNFIILLGDRYGWCPPPSQIPADEFDKINQHTQNPQERALLDMWYKLDKNAVPPEYVLQPRVGELEEYRDQDLWDEVESRLRQILLTGVEQIALPADAKLKYSASATEQEVFDGAFNAVDKENVFGFIRQVESLPVTETTKDFQNLNQVGAAWQIDQQAKDKLEGLKTNLRQTLAENITEYKVAWDQDKQLPDAQHLDRLCEDVYNRLEKVILTEIEQLEQVEPLDREIHAHQAFAQERARIFIGRETILEKIDGYLGHDQAHPLAVWGKSGTGKSALMAKAVQEAQRSHHEANLVYRFVGITPDASNGRSLLESLCRQITRIYGGDESTIPTAFDELVHELPNRFGLVKPEKPLILFIDALNQLSDADNAKDLDWLPSDLPLGVHIIVSTIPGLCLDALKRKLRAEDLLELGGLYGGWLEDPAKMAG